MPFIESKKFYDKDIEIVELNKDDEPISEIEMRAGAGDRLMLAVDMFEAIGSDLAENAHLLDKDGNVILPEKTTQVNKEGSGFLCKIYRITQSGVYRARIMSRRATATIIRFGRENALALLGKDGPGKTTCFICSRIVSVAIKSVLAAHGIYIPNLESGISWSDLQSLTRLLSSDLPSLLDEIREWIPGYIQERLLGALRFVFEFLKGNIGGILESVPPYLKNPIGWAAKQACKTIDLCPTA